MKSLLSSKILIGNLILLFVVGCRKDPHLVEEEPPFNGCAEDWCDEFPEPPEMGYNYTWDGTQYLAPCFNPNNSDEFVYIRQLSPTQAQLVKYNLITKQETILLDPMSFGPPNWGRQGWITFVYINKHVWKIRDNGTELTQLTFGEDDKNPMFNFSGDKIYYLRQKWYSNFDLQQNPELYKNTKMLVIDLNGNILDSIMEPDIHNQYNEYFTYQTWNLSANAENDFAYFIGGSGLLQGFYSLQGDTIMKVREWTSPQSFMDLDLCGQYLFYSRYKQGLFRLNINSGDEVKIKFGCDSRHYIHISISANGEKMLVQKVISTLYDDDQSIDEQNDIWLLDLNSCEAATILAGE